MSVYILYGMWNHRWPRYRAGGDDFSRIFICLRNHRAGVSVQQQNCLSRFYNLHHKAKQPASWRKKKLRAIESETKSGVFKLSPYRRAVLCWSYSVLCKFTHSGEHASLFAAAAQDLFFFLSFLCTYFLHFSIFIPLITVIRLDSITIACVARTFRIRFFLRRHWFSPIE